MPNRFTGKATAVQLREALEALELDPRGKKDTLLKRLNGAIKRSEVANLSHTYVSSSDKPATKRTMSQPLDAFLCFDVEATCVADKLIEWPNEIIVSVRLVRTYMALELMIRLHQKEFPVILLGWADEEEEDKTRVEDELDDAASSVSSEPSSPSENGQAGTSRESSEERTIQKSNAEGTDSASRELEQLNARVNLRKRQRESAAQTEDSTAIPPESDTTTPKQDDETECHHELDFKVRQLPGKKLVILDKFHSYVRPMWQPKLTKFCTGLTGITQETIDSAPTFPEMIKLLEQWLEGHDLLVGGRLRDKACWCTDGPWDLRDFVPKQLHITPLTPDPYPAFLRGPVLNVKDACNYVLSDLWYTSELERSAVLEAKYRATLEETRRKANEARLKAANATTGVQKTAIARPPLPESLVQKRLRNRPRLCSTGSWALSLKGMKMPKFQLTITGQLGALDLGEFQGQQHSGIDDAKNIARVVIELARRNVLLDVNEKPYQPQRFNWMGRPGQVFWNAKTPLE
ncbi:hypothetical protein QFC21_006003 [Naganishia friedmannii]|uniref:Uncharacterized protein n=1 Tax=Naganishia friedmannii TaxID=89922 RepID=A0ACC2V548_9TREE|nr:hypothetical protein QFC21_006003 [Naganishia friedmannii]